MSGNTSKNLSAENRLAWETKRLDAWNLAFGGPKAEAERIIANPRHTLRRLLPYLPDVKDQHVCSVQGSHGRVAVAFSALGAKAHVVDFSEENSMFALALAQAAGVPLDYTVCDILEAEKYVTPKTFDILVLELGILHYHQDLDRFFTVMRRLAKDGSLLLVNEFHPTQRKLFWTSGPQDYFSEELIEGEVPNPNDDGQKLGVCRYRFWTLGEIVTATLRNGFRLQLLDEHPDWDDPKQPGTFTLLSKAVV
ncbi:class I SAM-dependent methyltransferase [Roseibium sp. SCPC15]|uniref:class I SAM-dependent methyltransferase n=1 Tax=Roseibium sp. SCP15 TaxID=3141376 RepID=UPI00333D801B